MFKNPSSILQPDLTHCDLRLTLIGTVESSCTWPLRSSFYSCYNSIEILSFLEISWEWQKSDGVKDVMEHQERKYKLWLKTKLNDIAKAIWVKYWCLKSLSIIVVSQLVLKNGHTLIYIVVILRFTLFLCLKY